MKADSPDKLLARLERAANGLRWFLWLERHRGDILTIHGRTKVSGYVGERFFLGEGDSLSEAMAALDKDLAEHARRKREHAAFVRLMQP